MLGLRPSLSNLAAFCTEAAFCMDAFVQGAGPDNQKHSTSSAKDASEPAPHKRQSWCWQNDGRRSPC